MTHYGLNQEHKNMACVKWHENNHWKLLTMTGIGFHPKFTSDTKNGKSVLVHAQ